MKSINNIYIAVFLLLASCANVVENNVIPDLSIAKEQLILNQLEGKWYYGDQPFSGYSVVHHPNGVLAERVGFYNGKREGLAQTWFPDSLLRKKSFYKANKLDGKLKIWSPSPNSILIVKSNYKNGVRHGVQTRWHRNGQMSRRTNINLGKEEGLQQAWLKNGKIYINYEAKNGRTFGLRKATLCYELDDEKIVFGN